MPGLKKNRATCCALTLAVLGQSCPRVSTQIDARFSGCAVVEAGPACVLAEERPVALIVHWPKESQGLRVTFNGAPLEYTRRARPTGAQLRLTVASTGRLRVESRERDATFQLEFRRAGVAEPRAVKMSEDARAALRSGDASEAVRLLDASSVAHAARGAWSRAVRDAQAAAYALVYIEHQPAEATERLDRVEAILEGYPEGWALQPYYRGLIALASADPVGAIAKLRRAKARLRDFAPARVADIEQTEVFALLRAGREADAQAILRGLSEAPELSPCDRARRLNNAAWNALMLADAKDERPQPQVRQALQTAATILEEERCPSWPGHELLWLHRALERVLSGRFSQAEALLARVRPRPSRLDARLWRQELQGRIALGLGRPQQALSRFDEALQLAQSSLTLDASWRLQTRRASAFFALGKTRQALDALRSAERVLDDAMLRLPLFEGRGGFLADRVRSAQALALFHLDRGDASAAMCALRLARARGLARAADALRISQRSARGGARWARVMGEVSALRAQIEQAAASAWTLSLEDRRKLQIEQDARARSIREKVQFALQDLEAHAAPASCDALRPPRSHELVLSFHELGDGAVGFAASARGVSVHRFASRPKSAWGWLSPWEGALKKSARLRLIAGGPAALELAGAINGKLPVEHALDLRARDPRPQLESSSALVLFDGARNLSGARAEGALAQEALTRQGWAVRSRAGESATPAAVRDQLSRAALFHYAGHALSGPEVEDRLVLHRGALTARDILTAPSVPQSVVLMGCKTARSNAGELGLAQAFLLAGAEQVLATTEVVPDKLAQKLGAALYVGASPTDLDLAHALHRAVLDNEDADTSAFRVWSR